MMKKYWFIFYKTNILLEKLDNGTYTIPFGEQPPIETLKHTTIHNIASFDDGTEVKTFDIDTPIKDSDEYEMCGLRASYYKLNRELYLKAGKCQEILYWDKNTKFCGTCGAPMELHTDISKVCTKCGKEIWPQLATAIIVLIHRGDEIFLVHTKNNLSNYYGLVAGFVETGETLEEAVHREVMEETGLRINNLKYFGSQQWPYPCGLMVGFTADYESGEVKLQKSEISSGGWYQKGNMPNIPERLSIARRLIDTWLDMYNK